jgi:hypothetical protein
MTALLGSLTVRSLAVASMHRAREHPGLFPGQRAVQHDLPAVRAAASGVTLSQHGA